MVLIDKRNGMPGVWSLTFGKDRTLMARSLPQLPAAQSGNYKNIRIILRGP